MRLMKLPKPVLFCIETLEQNGYTAYAVGGCVRDHLLGIKPHDYDLCTNAKPADICRLFAQYKLVHSGEKHGTVGVVIRRKVYEITTYRTEGGYADNRHPDTVTFVDDIQEDLARRDFTINAIAYSPSEGYLDPFGGYGDLQQRILKTVGIPEERFREDALRILRGIRFTARFGLRPDGATLFAMLMCTPMLDGLARERVFAELSGYLPVADAGTMTVFAQTLAQVIPELRPCIGFQQNNPHHLYDVYTHTAHTLAAAPADLTVRMAALLHDIGKPACYTTDEKGIGHFYGHEARSAEMANTVLLRLKVPTAFRKQVVLLIENHMVLLHADKKFLCRRCMKYGIDTVYKMLALQKADAIGTGTRTDADLAEFDRIAGLLDDLQQESSCLSLKELAISGSDLIRLGIAPGPAVGQCLNRLLEQVIEEVLPNDKEALLAAAAKTLD